MRRSDRPDEGGGHGDRSREGARGRDHERVALEERHGSRAADLIERATQLQDRVYETPGLALGGGSGGGGGGTDNSGKVPGPDGSLERDEQQRNKRNAEADDNNARLRSLAGRRVSG